MKTKQNNLSTAGLIEFFGNLKEFEATDTTDTTPDQTAREKGFLKTLEREGTTGFLDAANVAGIFTNNRKIAALMESVYSDIDATKKPTLDYSGNASHGSKYSSEYLKIVLKATQALGYESVRFFVKDDFPLTIEWKLYDNTNIWFILAPRVDND